MADYVILHEIDKCTKCRGCQVACQRGQKLQTVPNQKPGVWANFPTENPGGNRAEYVQFDDPVVVRAQMKNDSPPFIRYSCWHCYNAPCVRACPFKAMKQDSATGAVYVKTAPDNVFDVEYCQPSLCQKQCVTACGHGGYPKVGTGDLGYKAYKCNMCLSLLNDPTMGDSIVDTTQGRPANNRRMPRCVYTCPSKALQFGPEASINAYINTHYPAATKHSLGNGHLKWVSNKIAFDPPNTNPFVENRISQVVGQVADSAGGAGNKIMTVPTVAAGALYALYRRRVEISNEEG